MFELLKKSITFNFLYKIRSTIGIIFCLFITVNNIHADNNLAIKELTELKQKIITLEKTLSSNASKTEEKTTDIKQKIIKNIQTQVKFSWRSLNDIKKYLNEIQKTYTMINKHANIKKAFYTDLLLQIIFIVSSLIISFILLKIIKVHNHTIKQSIFYSLSVLNFEIFLSSSNINSNLANIISTLFITVIITKMLKLYVKLLIKKSNYRISSLTSNILHLTIYTIYLLSITYSGFLFNSLINKQSAGWLGMLQLQSLGFAGLLIIFILSSKKYINYLIFRTTLSSHNPLIRNITLMWHWLLILIIVLLITTWAIKTTTLNILMNIIFTIVTIPAFSLLNRFIYGFCLLKIRKQSLKHRQLLLEWYHVFKKYIWFASFCAQALLLLFIWHINLINLLAKIFTASILEKIITLIAILYIVKAIQFFLDYFFLIRSRKQREQVSKLFRMCCNILLYLVTALIVIQLFGYEPWPAINSLGFISLGLGVGAQAIIKDIFSGFLLVLDNTVALGDTIIVDDQQGVVEELSLCTIKIRLENGTLLTIQYGELKTLGNKSKKYCYAILNTAISYDSDPEEAIKLIEQAYKNIKLTATGNKILAPIDIRGIEKISGYEIIIQSRIQTVPRAESSVARMFNLQIKKLFDKAGIKMPDPRLLVQNQE